MILSEKRVLKEDLLKFSLYPFFFKRKDMHL